jgi:Transglycosylase SLT domain
VIGPALAAAALLAALHGPMRTRERTLRPLLAREAREHRIAIRTLEAVATRESSLQPWRRGDHGEAWGLFQLHADAIPGVHLTRAQLADVASNAHFGALRLALARKRCGGKPERYAANFNGRRCGVDVYHLADAR